MRAQLKKHSGVRVARPWQIPELKLSLMLLKKNTTKKAKAIPNKPTIII
jgi:hypothetical protein